MCSLVDDVGASSVGLQGKTFIDRIIDLKGYKYGQMIVERQYQKFLGDNLIKLS